MAKQFIRMYENRTMNMLKLFLGGEGDMGEFDQGTYCMHVWKCHKETPLHIC
jgi:hypothetical protein